MPKKINIVNSSGKRVVLGDNEIIIQKSTTGVNINPQYLEMEETKSFFKKKRIQVTRRGNDAILTIAKRVRKPRGKKDE